MKKQIDLIYNCCCLVTVLLASTQSTNLGDFNDDFNDDFLN